MLWRWVISRLNYLVGGALLMRSALLLLVVLREPDGTRKVDDALGAWIEFGLVSGYAVAGAVVIWAGIAAGDEQRRFPVFLQAIATMLAAVGLGVLVVGWRARPRPPEAPSLTGSDSVFLLLVLALLIALAAVVMLISGIVLSHVFLRRARRQVGDMVLASRLLRDGPSEELIAAFAAQGVPPRVFLLAHVGQTLVARAQFVTYATAAVVFPAAILGVLMLGYARGDLRWRWPPVVAGLEIVFALATLALMVYAVAYCAAEATRFWSIVRRSRRFPESAAYVHQAINRFPSEQIEMRAPCTDQMAERVEAWSLGCRRTADRFMPLGLLAGLIIFILTILDRSGVKRIF